ncbi:MAG: hypothetical protein U9R36_03475 [Elusimicrobiota bacterium]|nr:hypothetical protein [Elusimicrobiota bacterium]
MIYYNYIFEFPGGKVKKFQVNLEENPLRLAREGKETENLPEWVKLEFHRCPNCPLDGKENPNCPVAVSFLDIISFFNDYYSYEKVKVTIEAKERTYSKETTLPKGISSIIGIYMVTSGCPVLAWLKPMARFHLPFAGLKETRYRVLSMYLLGQYFKMKNGETADWKLQSLESFYEEIKAVNRAMCGRLSKVGDKDANLNALIQLDTFAETILLSLGRENMNELKSLFDSY